ncbi:MAG: aldehyde ferredoxin oxidoreductase family protein [Candidatus Natronoplasma sp.]
MKGFFGKYLKVDLSTKSLNDYKIPEKWMRDYLGGRGIGARILLDEMDGGEDPLGPENILIFATGPLQGTRIPGAGRHVILSKSPKTGSISDSFAGGFFAHELATTGYDGIIIKGKAESPVYLSIDEDGPSINDAEDIWGEEVADVDEDLKERHDGGRVAVIGEAGENLVNFSCIMNDRNRAAGRPGYGAVMGSKNLKAVLAKGTKKLPIYDEDLLNEKKKEFFDYLEKSGKIEWGTYGTTDLIEPFDELGILPTKNFQEGIFEDSKKIDGTTLSDEILTSRDNCTGCPIKCKRVVKTEFAGEEVEERYGGPEYETLSALGSLCMNSDLNSIALANQKCNKYGLDTISVGNIIAFLMEASERGLIDQKIDWGDSKTLVELVDQFAKREVIGDAIAEGLYNFAEKLDADFAVTSKGQEIPMHDPRGKNGMGLTYATSPRGGTHNEGFHDTGAEAIPELGLKEISDRFSLDGKAKAVKVFEDVRSFVNSSILCIFVVSSSGENYNLPLIREIIEAATGLELDAKKMQNIGERNYNLLKIHSARESYTRNDDGLPSRLNEALPRGGSADNPVPEKEMQETIDEYYKKRGWDDHGPTPEKLKSLGMSKLIKHIP